MDRFTRRAALRAAVSVAAACAVAAPGRRRGAEGVVGAAAGGAAVAGAALERPSSALPLAVVALGGVLRGSAGPRSAVGGLALGAGTALALRRIWPVPPRTPVEVRVGRSFVPARPAPGGAGATVFVNVAAGNSDRTGVADEIRRRLPDAEVVEVGGSDDLDELLARAAHAEVIGVAGGDGSINAGADVARRTGKPLAVFPTGTLNHFTRDLGVDGIDDALTALERGHAVAVDTGTIDGRAFLNTASFGTYCDLVDARDRLEERVGKWPALVVALTRLLRTAAPIEIELDGRRRRLWMAFVGNCTYSPPGFAPAWREQLNDGWLDVRLVDASEPFSRARLLVAVLTGRLASTTVYEAFRTRELHVRADGPVRLARDGETFDGGPEFTISKGAPIVVYVPSPSSPA